MSTEYNLGAMAHDEITAMLKGFESVEISRHHLRRLRRNADLLERVARLIKHGYATDWKYPPIEETASQRAARKKVRHFLGVNEAQAFGVRYTPNQLKNLANIPAKLLTAVDDEHVIFPSLPVSLNDLCNLESPFIIVEDDIPDDRGDFVHRKATVRWMCIKHPKHLYGRYDTHVTEAVQMMYMMLADGQILYESDPQVDQNYQRIILRQDKAGAYTIFATTNKPVRERRPR